jgi:integration host factor subunit alpha
MTTTKKNITKKLSENLSLDLSESTKLLDFFLQSIKINSKNKILKLSNFGSFTYKETSERIGRNPKTKESYIITKRKKLIYKPSSKIKRIIN